MPTDKLVGVGMNFKKDSNELSQYMFFKRPVQKQDQPWENPIELPLDKALKGSITFQRDPDTKGRILQSVRVYKKTAVKKTTPLHETRYSRINVSKSRITVSFSFPLCDDPERLTARMQNFANVIIDESDEIAAMLNHEGARRVQEAWKEIESLNKKGENNEN